MADPPFVSGVLHRFRKYVADDPRNAYRGLVDRAHDACKRRLAAGDPAYVPAILVSTSTIAGVAHVSICDNGEAIVAEDVRKLYELLRSGRSGAVHRAFGDAGAEGAPSVVGQLGAGLLAAVYVADQIVITTRGPNTKPEDGVRYTCDSRTYDHKPCRAPRPGSVVQLRVRPDCQAMGRVEAVRATLVQHAKLLELPVRVGNDPTPINAP